MVDGVRRFRNEGGFEPPTDYLEVVGDVVWLVYLDGERKDVSAYYPIGDCLEYVDRKQWIELQANLERSSEMSDG